MEIGIRINLPNEKDVLFKEFRESILSKIAPPKEQISAFHNRNKVIYKSRGVNSILTYVHNPLKQ